MNIFEGTSVDTTTIHSMMMAAFDEYKDASPPSSALNETIHSIREAMKQGERSLLAFDGDTPVGMVRFFLSEATLYFFRLSVLPSRRGQGIAKALIKELEAIATREGVATTSCKVRISVPTNIALYQSLGYTVTETKDVQTKANQTIPIVVMEKGTYAK
ncbi:GNAT family N-acetyltransferase [Bacillus sp. Marseille-P3800]|uniref:GNAT family N-acetyltransferase n=1 Tax=Bacillus sp. Marseille-P3800 TaxID=2014782 RepID=UPI000C0848D4|nr:GNAT family N-acetyltransferase [Bacillus sp. Marseille-P3800]